MTFTNLIAKIQKPCTVLRHCCFNAMVPQIAIYEIISASVQHFHEKIRCFTGSNPITRRYYQHLCTQRRIYQKVKFTSKKNILKKYRLEPKIWHLRLERIWNFRPTKEFRGLFPGIQHLKNQLLHTQLQILELLHAYCHLFFGTCFFAVGPKGGVC